VSKASELDVRELLRLIAEQQASLGKLQQLVVEHVLSESEPGPSTVDASSAAANDLVTTIDATNVVSSAHSTPSDPDLVSPTEPGAVPAVPTSTPPDSGAAFPDPPETTPPPPEELPSPPFAPTPDSPFGDTRPAKAEATTPTARLASAPTVGNSRAGRYLNRRASTPARQVTNQDLYRLSRLRDVGDVAQLVLQFGEYRGATMFQVAQSDPDYLRSLALTAQRPQVRAAAMQLVRALEASEPSSVRRRSTRKARS
jgi:hypothetical protein